MGNSTTFEIIEPDFESLILGNVSLKREATGFLWAEGPVWVHDQQVLLFSDIPNDTMYRLTPCGGLTTFRHPSNYANGNTRDAEGRLITCEHGSRSVIRTEHNGSITTLVKKYKDNPLNSPNDVIVKSDSTIWFTDPTYGILSDYEGNKADSEQPGNYVYCFSPKSEKLEAVATEFTQPNGLAFSNDETRLFVAESGNSHDSSIPTVVRVFDVKNKTLENNQIFANISPGIPDGLRVDEFDNVWISASDGVHCYQPCGTLIGKINVPEVVSNMTFGGKRGNQLFITATSSVYSVFLNTAASKRLY